MGGAGFQLVIARTRNFPYITAAGLHHPELLANLTNDCPRRHDAYTESFPKYYAANISGPAALAELEAINTVTDTDSSSTERKHSFQAKRAKTTITHKAQFSVLAAESIVTTDANVGFWKVHEPSLAAVPAPSGNVHVGRASKGSCTIS